MEEKNKVFPIVLLIIFSLLFFGLFIYGIYMSKINVSEPVPTTSTTTTTRYTGKGEEIATFHGGVGEITYETVVYKIPNGHANMGFKYENKTCTTKRWGSSEWECTTTGKGEVTWTESVFDVAEENGATSYVTRPNDSKTYTLEQFADIFMMD